MTEQIGNVTVNYEYYEGQDFYSDGDVEDEILDIVKTYPANEFNRIIADRKSWPVLYHLSDIRGNILQSMPIDKDDEVLEIGAGCGAITGTLARKAKNVTCIDLSKRRSLINAYRNRQYNNIEIMVGNFQVIEPNLPQKYDCITLIGVLEYGALYIKSNEPYLEFLSIIKRHLKPNGRVYIAIENKFGMKYWAGCQEDHIGGIFKGIEGYNDVEGVYTFGRKELEKLIKKAGYIEQKFYYPYPDYKFPMVIYSDDFLPEKGTLNKNNLNFDRQKIYMFDESKVFDQVIDEGMFPFFSNSFLVEAKCGE